MTRTAKAAAPVAELEALWREFKERGSNDARERLILHYAPLVKYVAGRVATGLVGSAEPQYVALGDAINVAARLQSQAHPGSIVVGAMTARQREPRP